MRISQIKADLASRYSQHPSVPTWLRGWAALPTEAPPYIIQHFGLSPPPLPLSGLVPLSLFLPPLSPLSLKMTLVLGPTRTSQ